MQERGESAAGQKRRFCREVGISSEIFSGYGSGLLAAIASELV